MTYRYDGFNYLIRLNKGDLLVESLTKLAHEVLQGKSVWLGGLGGAQWAELGFYNLPEQTYTWRRFDQLMEITSLQGNLAWEAGNPVWHMHGTFGAADFTAIAGHVKELCVAGTCELLLHTVYGEPLARAKDDAVGLSLLQL